MRPGISISALCSTLPPFPWNLADPSYGGKYGLTTYTVYAQFRDNQGNESIVYSDTIDKVSGKPGNIILRGKFYETIQDAVDTANAGDTVFLTDGVYVVTPSVKPPRFPITNVGIVMKPGVTLMGAGAEKTTVILVNQGINISILNNTIAYNTWSCGICTRVSSTTITNNVITNNGSGISGGVTPIIRYNNVWNNLENYQGITDQTAINGNISIDPLFMNPANGNYRLRSDSPAKDAGTNVGIPYAGSAPDMGAFEYNGTGTIQAISNRADASFTIIGPDVSYGGSGTNWPMSNLPIGVYTITFTSIPNLYSPPYQAKTLLSGQTLTFDGTYHQDTVPPTGTLAVNFGEYATGDALVTLTFDLTDDVGGLGAGSQMKFSNDGTTWSPAEPYSSIKKDWDLTSFGGDETPGTKTVQAMVSDALGNWATLTDTILYVPNHRILEVPAQYSTIQTAIDVAQDGDTVWVAPGT